MPAVVLWSSFRPLCRSALGASLANMALFRVLRRFEGVLWRGCIFVWVEVFAWLVRLLCACRVRRLYDLWRVCLCFSSSLPMRLPFVLPCQSSGCLVLVILPVLSICVVLVALCGCVVVSFSLSVYAQKRKGARCFPCVLSSCVVGCPLFTPFPFQVSASTPDHNEYSCFAFLQ